MNYLKIKELNSFVIRRFRYTKDSISKDSWQSHAKELLANPSYIIKDDCDGLACTVAHILNMNGAQKVWRLLVASDGGNAIDHMVAMVEDDTGQRWIVGDTFSVIPCKLQNFNGRIFNFNNILDGINWTSHP